MTTYPLATLAATVDATGITAPSYADVFASLQASYQGIYGSDVYLGADSQDGQWIAIVASAINDCNAALIASYSAYSPVTASGAALSNQVKINGLARLIASNSSVDVTIVGVAGTAISNGIIADGAGNRWDLPSTVVIPFSGSVTVTVVAEVVGAITAGANTITSIVTPTRGWQTVTNPLAATVGAPVESDATLRKRQTVSTSLQAQSTLASIVGTVANLTGVQRIAPYENDTGSTDGNGIPAHTIALVVDGGDAVQIATAIAQKKSPGTGTSGTTTEIIVDSAGVPDTIRFFRPVVVRIVVSLTIKALPGYVSSTGFLIQQAVAAYVSGLPIGGDVYVSKLYGAADLSNSALGGTYNVTGLQVSRFGSSLGTADVVLGYTEAASLTASDVALTVT